jgi:hypothetical protein
MLILDITKLAWQLSQARDVHFAQSRPVSSNTSTEDEDVGSLGVKALTSIDENQSRTVDQFRSPTPHTTKSREAEGQVRVTEGISHANALRL